MKKEKVDEIINNLSNGNEDMKIVLLVARLALRDRLNELPDRDCGTAEKELVSFVNSRCGTHLKPRDLVATKGYLEDSSELSKIRYRAVLVRARCAERLR